MTWPNTLILAAFVSPALFYAGAAATSIPIIIHLLARRRFRRVRWAAIEFLVQAERQNRRRINLQQLILLALRCAAVLLLGLLVARPYLSAGVLADAFGTVAGKDRIFILDDSPSMGYAVGTGSSFGQARSILARLLEWTRDSGVHDRVTILRSSIPQEPVLERGVLDETLLRQTIGAVQALEPTTLPARFGELLADLRSRIEADPEQLDTNVYLISDFQKHNWLFGEHAGDSQAGSPLQALSAALPGKRTLSVALLPVAAEPRPNVALTRLAVMLPQMVATVESPVLATVTNFSQEVREPFALEVFLDDGADSTVAVPAIPAGEAVEVPFNLTFPIDGLHGVRVEIPHDRLSFDDHRTVACDVREAVNVLIINGEPAGSALEDEAALLQAALRPEGETYSGFQVSVMDESELDGATLAEYHVVVLANVYRIGAEAAGQLEQFVGTGGGLVFFLGDQVDAALYNQRLWREGAGVLPCRLGERIEVPAGQPPPTLVTTTRPGPINTALGGPHNPLLANLAFWQYFECVGCETGESTADAPSGPHVLARFTDPERHPAIVENQFGRGKVVLFASTADTEWNNWPRWPGFVVMVQELGQSIARPNDSSAEIIVGQPIRLVLDPAHYEPTAKIRTPSYPAEGEMDLDLPARTDGSLELLWPQADQLGLYQLFLGTTAGPVEQRLLAVNADPAESNLAACTEAELRRSAPDLPFEYLTDLDFINARAEGRHREFWPAMLLSAMLLLMTEQTLARWFGRIS